MATRSGKTGKTVLNEEDLETLRQAQQAEERRLRATADMLANDRDKLEKRTAELAIEREQMNRERAESGFTAANFTDMFSAMKDEFMREITKVRRDFEDRAVPLSSPSLPAGQRFFDSQTPQLGFNESASEEIHPPKISLREATDLVPYFNGYNMSLTRFTRACRRARDIVPVSYEKRLTKLLIGKLSLRAYAAVEDEPCDTVTQLIDLLNGAFGSPNTIAQYRGELSKIFLGNNEHVLDYIGRTKELRIAILDAERRERGELLPAVTSEIEILTARSFCDGLPLKFRLQLKAEHYVDPFGAFAVAKALAKRDELERQRHETARRPERTPPRYPTSEGPPRTPRTFNERASDSYHRDTVNPTQRDRAYPAYNNSRRFEGQRDRANPSYNDGRRFEGPRDRVARGNDTPLDRHNNTDTIWCRYCKNAGHEIHECRKRQYVNTRQGNYPGPSSGPDPPRTGPATSRPVRYIEAAPEEEEEKPESESSE